MSLNTLFMFMDESFDDPKTYKSFKHGKKEIKKDINFATLTGVLIPVDRLSHIQEKLYQLIKKETHVEILNMGKVGEMLHGCQFMPDHDDMIREKILNGLVEIIISNELDVIRVCNFVSKQNRDFYYGSVGSVTPHNMLIGKCFADCLSLLQETLKDSIIIPVVEDDENNAQQKKSFSSLILSAHVLLNSDFSSGCSMPNSKNMVEVLYSKKTYSLLTGLVDCVSYFLRLKQLYDTSENITPFQRTMIDIIKKIPNFLLNEVYCDLKFGN